MFSMSPSLLIILITVAISLAAFNNNNLLNSFMFTPYAINQRKEWYRFFSNGLIHADFIHLAVNMYVLYTFGSFVETAYEIVWGTSGRVLFWVLYITALGASVVPTYAKQKHNALYRGLGASGAVSAITFAAIVFEPMSKIYLFGVIPIPAVLFGVLYIYYCFYMSRQGRDNINHDAHLWGGIYGFVFTIIFKPSLLVIFIQKLIP
jgi:membrane associated rhomboid family serine protease